MIFVFHKSEGFNLQVTPYLDDTPRGLFATRAPRRPNPIGLSVVRILAVEGTTIRVADVDMLDGTPLLDIKPFVPAFDHRPEAATGWFGKGGRPDGDCADDRFEGWEGGSKAPSQ